MITPSEHEKNEWSRLAKWAYANDRNDLGHKYSGAASIDRGASLPVSVFDDLQKTYREWLVSGLKGEDCPQCKDRDERDKAHCSLCSGAGTLVRYWDHDFSLYSAHDNQEGKL